MRVLVTGGTGFIGSHCSVELLKAGHDIVCVDNLANSSMAVVDGIREITGKDIVFYDSDICDRKRLEGILAKEKVDACLHCAGLKSVGESFSQPDEYYRINVTGTLVLCEALANAGVWNFVYSSSATVYGGGKETGYTEDSPLVMPVSPYGKTKLFIEEILSDLARADERWSVCLLRYFNPVGAHPSGIIGENPVGQPNNVMPAILQAAAGTGRTLHIFGDDYPTNDGTCVRDYLHICDLAEGHVAALTYMEKRRGLSVFNLGRGQGVSVKELVDAFERENGVQVPHIMAPRRQGDVHTCFANVDKARKELGWATDRNVSDMVRDVWAWHLHQKKRVA